ncbi:MAG: retropepsin-like aspartic protease family protein, partial [Asticcacaulis sp.]
MLKPVIVMTCAVVSAVLAGVGFMGLDNRTPPDAEPSEPPVSAAVADNPRDTTSDTHITAIPKAADGHFWANATVNDKAVRFLVDTGATVVVLTEADAQRLGIDKTTLVFD